MTREGTIQLFSANLRRQIHFSFIKIGDDCVFCMKGMEGQNAEDHPYSQELGEHLREAHKYMLNQKDVVVAEWGDDHFDSLLMHEDRYLTQDLKDFYRLLKDDPRPKYYFARERMRPVAEMFNLTFVPVPFPNSYAHYTEVMEKVREIAKPDIIILFSCGMLAKILTYECHKLFPMTVIDLGSAFDPLVVGSTRSPDPDQHLRVKEFLNDVTRNELTT